jgi:hypothetical protein
MTESEDEDRVVAAQPRRSPRKRRAVQPPNDSSTDSTEKAHLEEEDLSENDESSGSENEATKAKGAKKKPTVNEEDSDPDEESDHESETKNARKRKARQSSSKNKKKPRAQGDLVERKCPDCSKTFTSKYGRDYHVNNRVCQPNLRPGGSPSKKAPPAKKTVPAKPKRTRGGAKKVKAVSVRKTTGDDDSVTLAAESPLKQKQPEEQEDNEAAGDDNGDSEYDEAKGSKGKSSRKSKKRKVSDSTLTSRTCPHCNKVFSHKPGQGMSSYMSSLAVEPASFSSNAPLFRSRLSRP